MNSRVVATIMSKVLKTLDITAILALIGALLRTAITMRGIDEYYITVACCIAGVVVIAYWRFLLWISTGRFSIFK